MDILWTLNKIVSNSDRKLATPREMARKLQQGAWHEKITQPSDRFLFSDQNSAMIKANYVTFVCLLMLNTMLETTSITKRSYSDRSVKGYITERTCWWNEVCKEEFQILFRCKCPSWSYCRSPGRYYNAVCSMTETGYIWDQPHSEWRGQ